MRGKIHHSSNHYHRLFLCLFFVWNVRLDSIKSFLVSVFPDTHGRADGSPSHCGRCPGNGNIRSQDVTTGRCELPSPAETDAHFSGPTDIERRLP